MKKLIPIAVLLISLTSFAQNKFIEVEVRDTISLKPLTFQCNLSVSYDYDNILVEAEEINGPAIEEKLNNKAQELKRTLESKKYIVKPLDNSTMGILGRRHSDDKGFTVIVNSIAEVQRLKDLVKDQNVTTTVTVLKYADEQKAEEILIKKLIDKAKARAAVIGTNSGLKVGRILEVKEGQNSNPMNSMKDFYNELMKMGSFGQNTGNYTGSLDKTFVVKFAAE